MVGTGRKPAKNTDFVGNILPSGTASFADGDDFTTITLTFADTARPGATFAVRLENPSIGAITTATVTASIPIPAFAIEAA